MDIPVEHREATSDGHSPPTLIEARRISKVYSVGEQTVRALDDVSLTIALGEFVAIMGPSGSGKSTMMNLIGALDVPSTGTMELDRRNIAEMSSDALANLHTHHRIRLPAIQLYCRARPLAAGMLPLLQYPSARCRREGHARCLQQSASRIEWTLSAPAFGWPNSSASQSPAPSSIAQTPARRRADRSLDSKSPKKIMALFLPAQAGRITVVVVTHEQTSPIRQAPRAISRRQHRRGPPAPGYLGRAAE